MSQSVFDLMSLPARDVAQRISNYCKGTKTEKLALSFILFAEVQGGEATMFVASREGQYRLAATLGWWKSNVGGRILPKHEDFFKELHALNCAGGMVESEEWEFLTYLDFVLGYEQVVQIKNAQEAIDEFLANENMGVPVHPLDARAQALVWMDTAHQQ